MERALLRDMPDPSRERGIRRQRPSKDRQDQGGEAAAETEHKQQLEERELAPEAPVKPAATPNGQE
jgi:hypothetical protein